MYVGKGPISGRLLTEGICMKDSVSGLLFQVCMYGKGPVSGLLFTECTFVKDSVSGLLSQVCMFGEGSVSGLLPAECIFVKDSDAGLLRYECIFEKGRALDNVYLRRDTSQDYSFKCVCLGRDPSVDGSLQNVYM